VKNLFLFFLFNQQMEGSGNQGNGQGAGYQNPSTNGMTTGGGQRPSGFQGFTYQNGQAQPVIVQDSNQPMTTQPQTKKKKKGFFADCVEAADHSISWLNTQIDSAVTDVKGAWNQHQDRSNNNSNVRANNAGGYPNHLVQRGHPVGDRQPVNTNGMQVAYGVPVNAMGTPVMNNQGYYHPNMGQGNMQGYPNQGYYVQGQQATGNVQGQFVQGATVPGDHGKGQYVLQANMQGGNGVVGTPQNTNHNLMSPNKYIDDPETKKGDDDQDIFKPKVKDV